MNTALADPFAPEALRAIPDELLHAPNLRVKHDPFALPALALDLGASMGYAYRTSAGVTSGAMNFNLRARETQGQRLLRVWRWLHKIHGVAPLAVIAYELVQHMGENQRLAAHAWAQYQGVVEMFAARNAIPIHSINVSTLKKAITGRGSKHPRAEGQTGSEAAKEAMLDAVIALGYRPTGHDEVDALGVLTWATELRGRR